jgi:aryl-alcohol dehydrogenase-like predicted oxidoreductase
MEKRRLGNSDLDITRIGVGAWAMGGGDYAFGWGDQDDRDSIAAIRRALDLGINWIDTAPVYGLGHSEEVVAKALEGLANRPYVFTKCSRVWDESRQVTGSLKAASVRRECEDSLRRLKVDVLDLVQVHWPEPEEEIEEGWAELAKLQKEGKIRWIGVSNFDVDQMERVRAIAPVTSLQPPYNLLRRGIEESILPYCQEHNVGVIVYSPMASGLLSGKMTRERIANLPENDWRRRSQNYQEPKLSENLRLVDILNRVAARHGVNAADVAIAWTLRHPAVTGAIVGVRRPDQVDGILPALEVRLDDADLAEIESWNPVAV